MAESVYTKLLRQAVEIEGSTQALATRLCVPEPTLERWVAGRAYMPYLAFLEVLKYVTEREHGLEPGGTCGEAKLSLNIGTNFARCPACDGTEFRCANPARPLRYVSTLTCRACGTEVSYGQLVVSLAKEASVHARARLVRLKRSQDQLRANDPRKKK